MIELKNSSVGLIEEVSNLLKLTDESIEIKDKWYIDPDYLITYLDELFRLYVSQEETLETLKSTLNEDMYDRYYERGGFPL